MKGFKLALIQTKGNCGHPDRFPVLQERIIQAAKTLAGRRETIEIRGIGSPTITSTRRPNPSRT